MSTLVTAVDNSPKYFTDSHSVQIMDSELSKVQSLDSEIAPNKSSFGPRKLISDALRAKLSTGEADKLAGELITLAQEAKRPSDRISAIAEITDRTEGKAVQSIRHAGVFVVAAPSADALAALDSWVEE